MTTLMVQAAAGCHQTNHAQQPAAACRHNRLLWPTPSSCDAPSLSRAPGTKAGPLAPSLSSPQRTSQDSSMSSKRRLECSSSGMSLLLPSEEELGPACTAWRRQRQQQQQQQQQQ